MSAEKEQAATQTIYIVTREGTVDSCDDSSSEDIYALYYDFESMDAFMKDHLDDSEYSAYKYTRGVNGLLELDKQCYTEYYEKLQQIREEERKAKEEQKRLEIEGGIKKSYNYQYNQGK